MTENNKTDSDKKPKGFEKAGALAVATPKTLADIPRMGTIRKVQKNVPVYAEKQLVEATMDFLTHRLWYMNGDHLTHLDITGSEARAAVKAWNAWRPVPVPNTKDPNRSANFKSPDQIKDIKRIRYVDTDGGILYKTDR